MFKKFFFYIVCSLLVSSCVEEQRVNSALYIKSVSAKVNTRSLNTDENIIVDYDTTLWHTGNDIIWYNGTTGELKFKEDASPKGPVSIFSVVIFLNDKILLSLPLANPASSNTTHFPCISFELQDEWAEKGDLSYLYDCEDNSCFGYFIGKGYPRWIFDEEREKNWKTIESEWNIFIEQLKKEDRYRE